MMPTKELLNSVIVGIIRDALMATVMDVVEERLTAVPAPRGADLREVQTLRKGQIIVEGKTRTPVKAIEVRPRGCRNKVHINSDCYDYGYPVWVQS